MANIDNSIDNSISSDDSETPKSTFDISQLPPSFQAFLDVNAIDPKIYTVDQLPRYVRWNTHLSTDHLPTMEQLKTQLKTDHVWEIQGMNGFFGIRLNDQQQPRLMDIPAYKEHAIFGIDLSSAIAVEALDIGGDDHVLDLCCAPGAKLCMISNIIGVQGTGTVTGVDIASHRLATCRSMVKKYRVGSRIRLYEADGTTFDVPAPSRLGRHVFYITNNPTTTDQHHHDTKEKEHHNDENGDTDTSKTKDDDHSELRKRRKLDTTSTTKKPYWAPKTLRYETDTSSPGRLYDKVLVDAECTHDGSISHILKYEKWGWDAFEKNFMDTTRLNTICQLQRDLMEQGWSLLRKDGYMVYSTCSLTIKQNEENVAWFLKQHPEAHLEKVPLADNMGIQLADIKHATDDNDIQTLMNKYCIRFDPLISRTSGFFLARFKKH